MRSITVTYHREDGSWWAESPEIEGFTAAGDSFTEVRELVTSGVPFYLDDDYVDIKEQLEDGAYIIGPRGFLASAVIGSSSGFKTHMTSGQGIASGQPGQSVSRVPVNGLQPA